MSTLRMPLQRRIPDGLFVGAHVLASLAPQSDCKRFTMSLKMDKDTLFQMSVRFDEDPDVVVRNSYLGGWGKEERTGSMPFERGSSSIVDIECKEDRFIVRVGVAVFCEYMYRVTEINRINELMIDGDVQVFSVDIPKKCN